MGNHRRTNGRHARGGLPRRGLFLSLFLLPARGRTLVRRSGHAGGIAALGTVVVLGAGLALADHPDTAIDLAKQPGLTVEHDNAVFIQGGVGAGTGTFDPFLTANAGGNADTESAINVCVDEPACPSPQFDTFTGGGRTHHLNLAAVPEIDIDGTLYREFSLDANDQGADDYMSIDAIEIYLDTEKTAGGFVPGAGSFAVNTGPEPFLAWELDLPILMRSQTFTPGSGVSDITVFVASSQFVTPEDCSYGSAQCEHYLYFYFEAGGFPGDEARFPGVDWNVTGGFEEWRTRLLPVVDVEKTVVSTFERTFDWTVTKTVSVDGGATYVDAADVDLFEGDDVDVDWKIEIDKGEPVDGNHAVSGTITITNPTGGDLIETSIPAVIQGVEDVITGPGDDIPVDVDCGVTFPYVLAAGATLVCTYGSDLPDGESRTNTATVTINDDLGGTKQYDDAEAIDFTGVAPTVTDDTADLTDVRLPEVDDEFSDDDTVFASETLECDDAGENVNTAVLTESDSGTQSQDSASVTITCHELTVSKDATPAFVRTFDWTVTKTVSVDGGVTYVDAATVSLFEGDDVDVDWKVEIDKSDPIDSGYVVTGTITITNPAPMAAVGVSVADMLTGGIAATVDCDPVTAGDQATVDVPAEDSATCSYSATLPNGDTRTNTASATLFGEDYTGTAQVDFTGVTPTLTDDTADLTDARLPELDDEFTDDDTVYASETLDCDDAGENVNTAVLTESDNGTESQDSASVTITCHTLTVTKDATPTFDRVWTWTIEKNADATEITINADESATINYEVDVAATHVDSGWAVSGTITITNPAPVAAVGVSVADMLTGGIAATVDCDPVTAGDQATVDVPAEDSATCSYSATLPNGDTRTNTATATLFGEDYTGTAQVDFTGVAPDETDDTIDVTDSHAGYLGQVTASPPDPFEDTFSYQRTVPGSSLVCGENLIENTATFVTTDTGATDSDDADVTITVICATGQGCTPGFWQGGVGFWMWDTADDPDFAPPGGNGAFTHDAVFNTWFTPVASLDNLTMIDLVGTGGGNDPARRAARSMVAAYLNALADGVAYPYTTAELEDMWTAAVNAGTAAAFNALHNDLDEKNNAGADLCGFPATAPLEASATGMASVALIVSLLVSAAWRGRHVRRDPLLEH
jgi:hypothetical protein